MTTVTGDQTSITGWAYGDWQDTAEEFINNNDPDIVVFDPSYDGSLYYDPARLLWSQNLCEKQLVGDKSVLILDTAMPFTEVKLRP